jgi:hypothetical protein
MKKLSSSKITFLENLYNADHTENSLLRSISSILDSESNIHARFLPIYIAPRLWQRFIDGIDGFKLIKQHENIFLFQVSLTISENGEKRALSGFTYFLKYSQYPNVYVAITLENTLFYSKGLLPYFKRKYPLASLTFISHKKLRHLLTKFHENNEFESFTIVRTTTYSRIGQRVVPSVNWPSFTLDKAFEWVAGENGWFQNLTFKIKKRHGFQAEISISRNGILKITGYTVPAFDDLILPIIRVIYRNVELFGNRARLDNPERNIRPLCIDFDENIFVNTIENEKFINSLQLMKTSSVSVLHANPYVHVSVFDYFDGSSFDIWVLSENKIIIVPQLKSSFQSIKRLINHIFDKYAEGDISEYEVAS